MTLAELFAEGVPAWLSQDVPLWAFLVALLTRPSTWSRSVRDYFRGERDDDREGGRRR